MHSFRRISVCVDGRFPKSDVPRWRLTSAGSQATSLALESGKMIVAALRTWMIAFLSVLLGGQQLACACAAHVAAPVVAAAPSHHGGHHVDPHIGHDPAAQLHAHHEQKGAPLPACDHCNHDGLSAGPSAVSEAAQAAQASAPLAAPASPSTLAWRLPVRSRERPPPLASAALPPPPLLKTRFLI